VQPSTVVEIAKLADGMTAGGHDVMIDGPCEELAHLLRGLSAR